MNTTTDTSEDKCSNNEEKKRSKSPASLKGSRGSSLSSDHRSRDSKSQSSVSLTKRSRSPTSRSSQRTKSPPSKVSKIQGDTKSIPESDGRRSTRDKFASERTNFESQITLEPKPIKVCVIF